MKILYLFIENCILPLVYKMAILRANITVHFQWKCLTTRTNLVFKLLETWLGSMSTVPCERSFDIMTLWHSFASNCMLPNVPPLRLVWKYIQTEHSATPWTPYVQIVNSRAAGSFSFIGAVFETKSITWASKNISSGLSEWGSVWRATGLVRSPCFHVDLHWALDLCTLSL